MVIDHIGIVVRSLDDAIQQWEATFGYRKNSDVMLNTRQKVKVVFLSKKGSTTVKLIEPSDATSPVFAFARKGGGLHHLCFRCQDLGLQISSLQKNGAVLMVAPQPGEAFNNNEIAFLMTKNNVNVELISTSEKAGWVDER
jgi:methylmalonyl-CoA/ethylmalonyl-CoA epimerase